MSGLRQLVPKPVQRRASLPCFSEPGWNGKRAKTGPCSLVHRLFMVAATPLTVDASGYVIIPSPKVFARRIFC